jgi:hypothetical protein
VQLLGKRLKVQGRVEIRCSQVRVAAERLQPTSMEKGKMEKGKMEMPMTGSPSLGLLLLPAAALLVGMGLMAGYVVRRRG